MSKPTSMFGISADYERLCIAAGRGEHPDTGEVIEDFEELDKLFEAIEDEAADKVAATAFVIQRLKADEALLDEEAKRLKAKQQAVTKRRERLTETLKTFMETTETEKVKTPSVSVTLGKPSKRVEIEDEKKLPPQYIELVTTRKVDRNAIKAALKAGNTVSGASLEDGKRGLTIK